MDDNGLQEAGFTPFCPRWRKRGKPPFFITSGSSSKCDIRYGPWIFPRKKPGGEKSRYMFCRAIEVLICKTMSLHDLNFDSQIYRQAAGGSIGLDLTGIVSDIYMCEWDK